MSMTLQRPPEQTELYPLEGTALQRAAALPAPYQFIKVDDYFRDYKSWFTLGPVISHAFDHMATLALHFKRFDGNTCVMLLQFPRKDTINVRFDPNHRISDDFTSNNSRSIVTDTIDDLLRMSERMTIEYSEQGENEEQRTLHLVTKGEDQRPVMQVVVTCNPFSIAVHKFADDGWLQAWKTALPGIYYAPNGPEDFAVIQAVEKPANAHYIGFGEQGGKEVSKNTAQLVYFNFDNMRYRQVYDRGPLEGKEPLYHSDPFFLEFGGVPGKDIVSGVFVDNLSQVCVDVGYLNSSRYMFGTRFGDFSYYFFLGDTCTDVLGAFTALVGKPRLKPRYILGYHQGCYGYENRQMLEETVRNYRAHQVPLDGLHVDVDIQHNYQTFTIDESKFPCPQEMFAGLKAQGVKCSTNITPIVSDRDPNYTTYREGLEKGYFVLDRRSDPADPMGRRYQDYRGGTQCFEDFTDPEQNFNSGKPFIGEVYYGGDRGTTGHYPDLARKEVRMWWGTQYQYLFDMGLEMVWQDMTTPAIRSTRGDMRGFPFRLLVGDDSLSNVAPRLTPAIKVWNLFSYNLHKATYHGLNNLRGRENKRNFIIGRGSFTGAHRFAGLWTGDNASSWDFLRINISQVLALGLGGVTISGEDIGGFEREEDWQHWADPELLIRWTCAGAFLPWFRNHYIAKGLKYFQEPYAYQYVDLDQWNIPQEKRYLYSSVLPICKHYIELRYRLLQLFYDAMFENILNGMPICRAMFLNDGQDQALFNDKLSFLDNQFFVRKDLLVAPMLQAQGPSNSYGKREVYLPAGSNWYAFMDNKRPLMPAVEGGTTIFNYDAHIEASSDHIGFIMPLFVREGAIIPTVELEQYVGERNAQNLPNPITLNIYPGQQGQYTMYLDDGVSRSSAPPKDPYFGGDDQARGEYRETRISHVFNGHTREIKVERVHDNYTPRLEQSFFVAVLHSPFEAIGSSGPLCNIWRDGQAIRLITEGSPEQRAAALAASNDDAWYYNEHINASFIKVFDNNPLIALFADYI